MEQVPPHTVDALIAQGVFEPVVERPQAPVMFERVLVCGMGGSELPARLLRGLTLLDIDVHDSYGLPAREQRSLEATRVIICSFSGDTAESVDAFHAARKRGITPSVITTGGKLLHIAKSENTPHVQVPDIGIPPRECIVFMALALLSLLGREEDMKKIREGLSLLSQAVVEAESESMLKFLGGKTPLLYGPNALEGVLKTFKVNFNETSRRPSFVGMLPEINHNEIEMFDGNDMTLPLVREFAVLLFIAEGLDLRLSARSKLLAEVLTSRGVPVHTIHFEDWSWRSALSAIAISMRTSGLMATRSDLLRQPAALITEFKSKMKPFDDPGA